MKFRSWKVHFASVTRVVIYPYLSLRGSYLESVTVIYSQVLESVGQRLHYI